MRIPYKKGWYSISVCGLKYCVSYSIDGTMRWKEDLPLAVARNYGEARLYCEEKLSDTILPIPADPENTTPPTCKQDCKYRQKYAEFALQKNALRVELASMVNPNRCGWNILPGRIGGHPFDYAPCYYA